MISRRRTKCAVVGDNGEAYGSIRELSRHAGVNKNTVLKAFARNGFYKSGGVVYTPSGDVRFVGESGFKGLPDTPGLPERGNGGMPAPEETGGRKRRRKKQPVPKKKPRGGAPDKTAGKRGAESRDDDEEYQEFLRAKAIRNLPFKKYDFKYDGGERGYKWCVALFSDAHIEETVTPASVLNKNEYNFEIAKERIGNYFVNLVNCLNDDGVEYLIFASLGDMISGYIHEELSQCNSMSPMEAVLAGQNLLYSGLSYICDNARTVKRIEFIGIVGNHGRTTKKMQHANGYKMNYEWMMYSNLERECAIKGLPVNFNIPESEMALVHAPNDMVLMFMHGFQVKSTGTGTVSGIYPALGRLCLRLGETFHQDKVYIGHFHSCVSIRNAVVNGSIIGYNAYALSNNLPYEKPAQMYEVYDSNVGLMNTRRIYCEPVVPSRMETE